MYCLLDKKYFIRGWKDTPYVLLNYENNEFRILLSPIEFQALSFCDGKTSMGSRFLMKSHVDIIEKFKKLQVVKSYPDPFPIENNQKYKLFDFNYISAALWSITGKCNYRCKHCFMSAPDAKYGELSYDRCKYIINQLSECGIRKVYLTGGEPLVRKDFLNIVDELLDRGIKIGTIYSNGKLVTKDLLNELEKRNVRPEFNMSFDGIDFHDWLRGINGAEKYVIDAFKLCKEHGFPTGSEMCIHRKNKDSLRSSINFLADLGVESIKVCQVENSNMWSEYHDNYSISLDELYNVYLEYIPFFYQDGMRMNVQLEGFFFGNKGSTKWSIPGVKFNLHSEDVSFVENRCVCEHAKRIIYISAEGRVLPCMPVASTDYQNKFPIIFDDGLNKCLADSFYEKVVNTNLKQYLGQNKKCAICEYRYKCGGGCRAKGLCQKGSNFFEADPCSCKLFKEGYVDKIKLAADNAIKSRLQTL